MASNIEWASEVILICSALISLGKLIDWLLRLRHKEAILDWMKKLEKKFKTTSVREWQVKIALWGFEFFWSRLRFWLQYLMKFIGRSQHGYQRFTLFPLAVCLFVLIILGSLIASILAFFDFTPWYASIFAPAGFIVWYYILLMIPALSKYHDLLGGNRGFGTLLISLFLTFLANLISLQISQGHPGSYWFEVSGSALEPNHSILLAMVNFPFDFLTIYISVILLHWVSAVPWSSGIAIIAIIDILISVVLTIGLHTILKIIETGNAILILDHMSTAWNWFVTIITFKASHTHPDWPLTPILFTTFVPVTAYMSIFVLLAFVLRPLMCVAGYLCGLFGEKKIRLSSN